MSLASLEEYLPFPLQLIVVAFIGLSFGSFGTMLLHRIPRGGIFGKRSACPRCNRILRWVDLVPVLSFILLRGRCRSCREPISFSYPLTEFLSAALFVLFALRFREMNLPLLLPLLAAMETALLIALYDARTQQIPDVLTILLTLSALCYRIVLQIIFEHGAIRDGLFGVLPPLVLFGTMWIVSRGRWIGSGDIFLGAALGFLVGFPESILMLFLAYVAGGIVAAYLLFGKKVSRKTPLAFGPFLVAAAIVTMLGGDALMTLYLKLLRV